MSKDLTDWFPISTHPARDGVYEVTFPYRTRSDGKLYSRWYFGAWRSNSQNKTEAACAIQHSFFAYNDNSMQWRGLASDPSKGTV